MRAIDLSQMDSLARKLFDELIGLARVIWKTS